MTEARIYLTQPDSNDWIPMVETPYAQEVDLQKALVDYPDLIPGDQINPDDPRRWLFVKDELGVPEEEGGGSIWSLDHLFIDQDSIPTFIECKRAVDTRSRREVVAQMLDYAANGTEYWPVDRLRQAAAETARKQGHNLDDQILQLIERDEPADVETYWEAVEENLRNGRIRLIFVADTIPRTLRRLVEFLNSKMNDVEVLAVEVKQFIGKGQKAMVPRVIGITEATRGTKPGSSRPQLTRTTFLAKCPAETAQFFEYVLDTALDKGYLINWGTTGFSVRLIDSDTNQRASFAYGYHPDKFEFYFGHLPYVNVSDEHQATLRQDLLDTGMFEEAGEKTLRLWLKGEENGRWRETYDLILTKMDEIVMGS